MKILGIAPLTAAWHGMRRVSITGTDVPKILGVSDYGSAVDVWARVTGKLPPEESDVGERPWLEWGTRTEEMHRRWVGDLAGVAVSCSPGLVQHPELPWLMATPDGLYAGPMEEMLANLVFADPEECGALPWLGCLETKAPSPWTGYDPKEAPPLGHQAQVAAQLACTGLSEAILSSLSWPGPKWARFERDEQLIQDIIGGLVGWYERHIVKDTMPEVLDGDLATIKRLFPKNSGRTVELPESLAMEVEGYKMANEALRLLHETERKLQAEKDGHDARIRAAMGDAQFASLNGVTFLRSIIDRKSYTVDSCRYTTLRTTKEIK